ncbi:MAG: hypothetical protein J6B72_00965 [Clostridia bacterium]|nr:hypothetical protein [Clostridia bacterium]
MKKYTAPTADMLALMASDVIAASKFNVINDDADFDLNTYNVDSKYFAG